MKKALRTTSYTAGFIALVVAATIGGVFSFRVIAQNQVPVAKHPTRTLEPNATAQCRDGWYSYSFSRVGSCSHHGGVRTWL